MATVYGAVEKIADVKFRDDCQAIYDLLSTDAGMKTCRELLRVLGAAAPSGEKLAGKLVEAEQSMGFGKYAWLRGDGYAFPPPRFLNIIANKYVIVDDAVGRDHGANTHRLQWWLVHTAWVKTHIKLNHKPGELYDKIGREKATGSGKYVWDDLFDHAADAKPILTKKTKATFGYPEYFCGTWLKEKATSEKGKGAEQIKAYNSLGKAFIELESMAADKVCPVKPVEMT